MSEDGFRTLASGEDGKNLFWTTDIKVELPIITGQGASNMPALTLPRMFLDTVKRHEQCAMWKI